MHWHQPKSERSARRIHTQEPSLDPKPLRPFFLAMLVVIMLAVLPLPQAVVIAASSPAGPLGESEKQRIQWEEKYREGVRSQLHHARWWDWLNSNLPVAVFTSLVAAFLLNVLRQKEQERKERKEKAESIDRLRVTAELRLSEFKRLLRWYEKDENRYWPGTNSPLKDQPSLAMVYTELELLRFGEVRGGGSVEAIEKILEETPANDKNMEEREERAHRMVEAIDKLRSYLREYRPN